MMQLLGPLTCQEQADFDDDADEQAVAELQMHVL
jgi:hypothetical protein